MLLVYIIKLSFLSLPAFHLCHQGLGWSCMIVTSIIYQQLIMTPNATDLIFIRVNIYSGPGEGGIYM